MNTAKLITLGLLRGSTAGLDGYLRAFVSAGTLPLWMDGTLNGPKIANRGSTGSAIDGTATDITISGGMVFNGTTSAITVPQHADLTGVTSQEWVFVANPVDAGEGSAGLFFRWGLGATRAAFVAGPSVLWVVDYTTGDPVSSAAQPSPLAGERLYYFSHDGATRVSTLFYGSQAGVQIQSTSAAGTGTLVAPAVDLVIGNNNIGTATFNGVFKLVLCFNRQLTSGERTTLAGFFASTLAA